MAKKEKPKGQKLTFERPVEKHFYDLDQSYGSGNLIGIASLLSVAFFSFMGLIWMIPFPQFDFLVKMNAHTFLNWGSFFIAIVIYSYLKLAPTLSYAMLFSIGIMSFFIVQLEYVERDGGPSVVLVCGVLLALSLLGLWLLSKKTDLQGKSFGKLLSVGPIWLWSKVFGRFNWKY